MVSVTAKKRLWPTLLGAAGEAAMRSTTALTARSGDVHTAIIMSRTSFDAYLHELINLRRLERYVRYRERPRSIVGDKSSRIREIEDRHDSVKGLCKTEREKFKDVRYMDFDEKLEAVVGLLMIDERIDVRDRFQDLFLLNKIRNAIIHHSYGERPDSLLKACSRIALSAGTSPPDHDRPWEELLVESDVAFWACRATASAILVLETFPRNRQIHFDATKDVVLAAISPMELAA